MAPSVKSAPKPLQNAYHRLDSLSTPETCKNQCQMAITMPRRHAERMEAQNDCKTARVTETVLPRIKQVPVAPGKVRERAGQ